MNALPNERPTDLTDNRLVYVANHEADILALMLRAHELGELDFYLPPHLGHEGQNIVHQVRTLRNSLATENEGLEATAILAKEIEPPPLPKRSRSVSVSSR